MKKFYVFIFIIFSLFITACNVEPAETSADKASIKSVKVVEEPLIYQEAIGKNETTPDETAKYKEASYNNFLGKGETDFVTEDEDVFDLAAIIETAGCTYYLDEKTGNFVIAPVGYEPAEDFRIEILASSKSITGDIVSFGRLADDAWDETARHNSATDFTTKVTIGTKIFTIGYDEFDHLYRQIRTLTVPNDKFGEVNATIDAEIESYCVVDAAEIEG